MKKFKRITVFQAPGVEKDPVKFGVLNFDPDLLASIFESDKEEEKDFCWIRFSYGNDLFFVRRDELYSILGSLGGQGVGPGLKAAFKSEI